MPDKSDLVYQKQCQICGKDFSVGWSQRRAVYCCDECRKIGAKRYERKRVKARAPNTERTCKKCGHNFMGRYRQRYCLTCLNDGSGYMTKLLNQRNPEDEMKAEIAYLEKRHREELSILIAERDSWKARYDEILNYLSQQVEEKKIEFVLSEAQSKQVAKMLGISL